MPGGERGGVVQAVADHQDLVALRLQSVETRDLTVRAHPAMHRVDPGRCGGGAGSGDCVA